MPPKGCTHLAVVSDDRLFGDGLVQVLSEQPDFVVTARRADAGATIAQLARDHHVILLDVRCDHVMRGGALPDAARVIYVGGVEDDAWATAMLLTGARGILTGTATRSDLVHAVRVVCEGGIWARRRWLNACVLHVADACKQRLLTQDTVDTRLSRREREVLQHAATGVGNKELADRLSISEATVKVHLTHIFQKLGVPGRAALAAVYHDVSRTTNVVNRHSLDTAQNHPSR